MEPDRLRLAGPVTVLVSVVAILTAVAVAPRFSLTADALSNLGIRDGSAPIFNWGLVVAGLVGLGFAAWLVFAASNVLQRAGGGLTAIAMIGLAGVGVFPMDKALHVPAALGFYLGFTYAMFLHGTGSVRGDDVSWGLATIWVGIAHVSGWLVWFPLAAGLGWDGIAIPELYGAAIIGGWTLLAARRT